MNKILFTCLLWVNKPQISYPISRNPWEVIISGPVFITPTQAQSFHYELKIEICHGAAEAQGPNDAGAVKAVGKRLHFEDEPPLASKADASAQTIMHPTRPKHESRQNDVYFSFPRVILGPMTRCELRKAAKEEERKSPTTTAAATGSEIHRETT